MWNAKSTLILAVLEYGYTKWTAMAGVADIFYYRDETLRSV
jgi:hypothetical protein